MRGALCYFAEGRRLPVTSGGENTKGLRAGVDNLSTKRNLEEEKKKSSLFSPKEIFAGVKKRSALLRAEKRT